MNRKNAFAVLIAAVLIVGSVILLTAPRANATSQEPNRGWSDAQISKWGPCPTEDSFKCVWDAKHRGNGQGHSVIKFPKGKMVKVSHKRAHRLVYGS